MRRIAPLTCGLLVCVMGCFAMKLKPNKADAAIPAHVHSSNTHRVDAIDGRPAIVAKYPSVTMLTMVVLEPGEHLFTVRGPNQTEDRFTAVVEPDKDYDIIESELGLTIRPLDDVRISDIGSNHDSRARINDAASESYRVLAVDGQPAICSSFRCTTMETMVEVEPGEHIFTVCLHGQLMQLTATVEQGKEYSVSDEISEWSCWGPMNASIREQK